MTDDQQPRPGPGPSREERGEGTEGAERTAAGTRWPGWGEPGAAAAGEEPEEPRRRLRRGRKHKVVSGVCGGLGRYFDLDPVIFRVPLVVLSVVGGLGLIFYGFAWLFIPAEGEKENEARRLLSGRVEGTSLSAVLVALVGCGLFLASLGNGSIIFSLMLVAAVAGAAYWSQHRRQAEAAEAEGAPVDPTTAHAVADAPPETQAPPAPSLPSWWREPLTKDGSGRNSGPFGTGNFDYWRDTGYLWGPDGDPYTDSDPTAFVRRRRGDRQSIGGLVLCLAVLAGAIGTSATWGTRSLSSSLTLGLGLALAVFALGLVISAFVGRVGGGTILSVVLTAVLLAGAALLPKDIGTDWRDSHWKPGSASAVRQEYRTSSGEAELDLSELKLKEDETIRTGVRAGAGQLKVVVPASAEVRLDAHVGAGEIRLPLSYDPDGGPVRYDSAGGLAKHRQTTLEPFDEAESESDGSGARAENGEEGETKAKGTLDLSLRLGVGQIEVVRVLPSGERSDGAPQEVVPGAGQWEGAR
ncbi:PspC domain-containing protein [Streptomyces daliensis]